MTNINGTDPRTMSPTQSSPEQIDVEVSDLDSDIELDDLLPTYLKIKGKLYEIDPILVETTRKHAKGARSKKMAPSQMSHSPAVRKLLSQLQQITSDALFDEREAEAQWPAKRNQIAQDLATKRQSKESPPVEQNGGGQLQGPSKPPSAAPSISDSTADTEKSEDEADLLGGMFTAVPSEPSVGVTEGDGAASENITLRDFGKSSGLTPRRLLEEAVRSR